MSSKFLTFIFVVLFVLFIGEVGYLYYTSQQKTSALKSQANLNEPTYPPGEQAIGAEIFTYLSKLDSGIITSSRLKNYYEGTLVVLDNKMDDESVYYGLKIEINGKGTARNGFIYNKDEVNDKITFFLANPGKSDEKITINDLKVGSKILIEEELDLLENDLNFSLLSARIILISK